MTPNETIKNLQGVICPVVTPFNKRGGVDENVLAAIVRLNEAEAFLVVVEFHGARIHRSIPFADLGALDPKTRGCAT